MWRTRASGSLRCVAKHDEVPYFPEGVYEILNRPNVLHRGIRAPSPGSETPPSHNRTDHDQRASNHVRTKKRRKRTENSSGRAVAPVSPAGSSGGNPCV